MASSESAPTPVLSASPGRECQNTMSRHRNLLQVVWTFLRHFSSDQRCRCRLRGNRPAAVGTSSIRLPG